MQENAREEGGGTEPTSRTCRVVAMVIVIRMHVKELCGYDRCDGVSGGRAGNLKKDSIWGRIHFSPTTLKKHNFVFCFPFLLDFLRHKQKLTFSGWTRNFRSGLFWMH